MPGNLLESLPELEGMGALEKLSAYGNWLRHAFLPNPNAAERLWRRQLSPEHPAADLGFFFRSLGCLGGAPCICTAQQRVMNALMGFRALPDSVGALPPRTQTRI